MSKGYKTFREFVDYREGATIRPTPGTPASQGGPNADAAVDAEIANNPQLLKQGMNPQQQKTVDKAVMTKKTTGGRVSMDAALKAASMQQKRLQQNAGVGGAPGGM